MTDRHSTATLAEISRRIADFLDSLGPDVPTPTHVSPCYGEQGEVQWLLFGDKYDLAEQKVIAQAVIRGVGGKWEKSPAELFSFCQTLPSGVQIEVTVKREAVCQRVVTGSRKVARQVPDPTAPMVEVTERVEDVEWICEPLLADEREPEPVSA